MGVQSVEKYADLQPQQMLARVAAGNAVQNFVFCLNKVDQLASLPSPGVPGDGEIGGAGLTSPMLELREVFAARLARTLSLSVPSEVFLISAASPGRYELPRLRGLL